MSFRLLAPLVWIVALLALVELAVELRAVRRGWPTLLFSSAAVESARDEGIGPSKGFPFRSRRIEAKPRPGVVRLWFASSSYGEDVQQAVDDVFPNRAAALLREHGVACEAVNASVAGHTLLGNIEDLARHGEHWRPQVVVLYQMSNDIDKLSAALCSRGWSSPSAEEHDTALQSAAAGKTPNLADQFVESTTFYKHLKSSITAHVARGRMLERSLGERGAQLFELRVRAFLERCRALDATAVLCTFPTAYTLANAAQTPVEYELNLLRFNVFLSREGWLDSVERFNAVLRHVAQSEGVALIDLAERFAGRAELFRDMWHLTREGHEEVAQQIADELARLPRVDQGRRR